MPAIIDLTGQKFSRLTVVERAESCHKRRYWLCLCDCGNRRVVMATNLRRGDTKSCGCLSLEMRKERFTTHGARSGGGITSEYMTWQSMKKRCGDPNYHQFYNYGGRGIGVCDRWRESFENFLEDLGPKPSPRHSIERVDNDGPYSPENCIWATSDQQSRNKRSNHYYSFMGQEKTVVEWAEIVGMAYNTLHMRLTVYGWPVEKALMQPVRKHA